MAEASEHLTHPVLGTLGMAAGLLALVHATAAPVRRVARRDRGPSRYGPVRVPTAGRRTVPLGIRQ